MKRLQILCPSLPASLPYFPSLLSSSLPPPLLPHPLQSPLDASSRRGLGFQAEPQLALRVIIIHLRALPPQPLLLRSAPSPPAAAASGAVPPARQLWSPKGDSEFVFIMLMIIIMMLLITVIISSC